jgi:ketosteroid isomerase-like protein
MSEKNLEIVRRVMDAVVRRDMETVESLASDTVRFDSTLAASEGRAFSGPTAVRDYFAAFDEAFDEVEIHLEEVLEAVDGRVVVRARVLGRGRGSGIALDQDYFQVWMIAGGKVQRLVSRSDLQSALDTAGLAGQD